MEEEIQLIRERFRRLAWYWKIYFIVRMYWALNRAMLPLPVYYSLSVSLGAFTLLAFLPTDPSTILIAMSGGLLVGLFSLICRRVILSV